MMQYSLTLFIVILSLSGVIIRPWKLPEAIWAVSGALLLLITGLLPLENGMLAVNKGTDVYLFLIGMMLLSALAQKEGLFDTLAAVAVKFAKGSASRLFFLTYATGTCVTIFMSNDATAVVLTPAVFAAAKAAKAKPLPYLYICAFVANAASFVLPISNPANLVLFESHMPPLATWLSRFVPPSLAAISITYVLLYITQRKALRLPIEQGISVPALTPTGIFVACGIIVTALSLMAASAMNTQLGLPTFICSMTVALIVMLFKREMPWNIMKDISWAVLPLVAGLFVLVEGLNRIHAVNTLGEIIKNNADIWSAGVGVALVSNVMNNLPAGLIAGMTVTQTHLPYTITNALLVGVDLGPNLSITGSLATILWLTALRREGQHVSAGQFLKLGSIIMFPALLGALAFL